MKMTIKERQARIHSRVRRKISGTAARPRMSIFRSNKSIYVQLIDDVAEVTLAAASSKEAAGAGTKIDQAKTVGQLIAEKAKAAGISKVVFDRGGYLYHGRVKAVADGAREAGMDF
jgi:large subunit ribosomal protein L18